MKKEELNTKLWNIANKLRGRMDSNEFKKYILGFIFFKYISFNVEKYLKNELEIDKDDIDEDVKNDIIDNLGYFIHPNNFYSKIIEDINNKENIDNLNQILENAFHEIEISTTDESRDDFAGLFDEIELNDKKLGDTQIERNQLISKIMLELNDIEFNKENNDFLGDSYEYLISKFASDAGKKGGEFYTPTEVSKTIAKIIATAKKAKEANFIYDPTCGSGSLLIRSLNEIKNLVEKDQNSRIKISTGIKGQELNHTTYNLARMNMILHGFDYYDFKIKQGDTIRNDKFINEKKFDIIVANPPFGTKWDPNEKDYQNDERFSIFDSLAPASRAEFAFIQHMLYHLSEDGIMATVLPHGILFRGGSEEKIRRQIIENYNWFDAIISLPSNLFFGTGIPAIIAIFKKCRENNESILFIDASREFEKAKNKNKLREEDILKIVDTYKSRKEIEKYSRNVSINEIKENDFNLNVSRYIDNFEEETYRPIEEIKRDILEAEEKEIKLKKELQELEKRIFEEIFQNQEIK